MEMSSNANSGSRWSCRTRTGSLFHLFETSLRRDLPPVSAPDRTDVTHRSSRSRHGGFAATWLGLGITPRKSLTLRWPTDLDECHARPFLLGYFDGDGYITWSRNGGYLYPRWGLIGTRAFLEAAMDVVVAETGIRARNVRKEDGRQIHGLGITGRDAWTIDEWLHADGNLGLARKRLSAHPPGKQAA
jgi:hypothetical protein